MSHNRVRLTLAKGRLKIMIFEPKACASDAPLASIKFDIRALNQTTSNMDLVGVFSANLPSDEAVNGQCGGGTAHRFGVQLPSWTKGRQITLTGIDTMFGSNFLVVYEDADCPALAARSCSLLGVVAPHNGQSSQLLSGPMRHLSLIYIEA